MKILTLHSDFIEFEAKKKAIKDPEKVEKGKHRFEECLVVFTAVEKSDEINPKAVTKNYVSEIKKIAEEVKTKTIVLYPYVHLSPNPSKPDVALKILKSAEKALESQKYTVGRSPFGWYKAFTISCKGHPLSELSREFTAEAKTITEDSKSASKEEDEAIKAEEKAEQTREFFILDTDGKLVDPKKFDFNKHKSLKIFYNYDTKGSRAMDKEPPHIELMKKMELVDYEPGSDSGNLRWYPKGLLIKKLLEEHVTNLLIKAGAMQVETPIMYDYQHPALSKYLTRFPARQYKVLSDDKWFFLRFSACFGQYLMKHDMTISYKNLPLRMYELTHYSFRREQRGELAGLKRLRAFTMPDMHTLCQDTKQAQDEFINQYKISMQFLEDMELDYDVAIRTQIDFYKDNEKFFKELSKIVKKPILIEMFKERYAYFIMKHEFSVNDALNKAATLSTVQMDVENTERFDITFTDKDGKKKHPPIMLHASVSGGIDRDLYALLEAQALKAKIGEKPMLPLWLSPSQVRIIPVSTNTHLKDGEKLMEQLKENNIRADIDDNEDSIGKRIRNAEREWIPYIIVIGDEEIKSGLKEVQVRIRATGKQSKVKTESLIKEILKKTDGKPTMMLPLPDHLTKRPIFVG
ncbi:threonine--tRNA ligase [Nanoarchaeota archaeon]